MHENINIYNKPSQRLCDMGISLLCVKYDTRHEASFSSVLGDNPFVTMYVHEHVLISSLAISIFVNTV